MPKSPILEFLSLSREASGNLFLETIQNKERTTSSKPVEMSCCYGIGHGGV